LLLNEDIWPGETPWYTMKFETDRDYMDRFYGAKQEAAGLVKPRRVVEIGVRCGYGGLALMRGAGWPGVGIYVGFDTLDEVGELGIEWARRILAPWSSTIFAPFDTQSVDDLLVEADFVHVDGSHEYPCPLHDLQLAARTTAKHILIDDMNMSGVQRSYREWTVPHKVVKEWDLHSKESGITQKQVLLELT